MRLTRGGFYETDLGTQFQCVAVNDRTKQAVFRTHEGKFFIYEQRANIWVDRNALENRCRLEYIKKELIE